MSTSLTGEYNYILYNILYGSLCSLQLSASVVSGKVVYLLELISHLYLSLKNAVLNKLSTNIHKYLHISLSRELQAVADMQNFFCGKFIAKIMLST